MCELRVRLRVRQDSALDSDAAILLSFHWHDAVPRTGHRQAARPVVQQHGPAQQGGIRDHRDLGVSPSLQSEAGGSDQVARQRRGAIGS